MAISTTTDNQGYITGININNPSTNTATALSRYIPVPQQGEVFLLDQSGKDYPGQLAIRQGNDIKILSGVYGLGGANSGIDTQAVASQLGIDLSKIRNYQTGELFQSGTGLSKSLVGNYFKNNVYTQGYSSPDEANQQLQSNIGLFSNLYKQYASGAQTPNSTPTSTGGELQPGVTPGTGLTSIGGISATDAGTKTAQAAGFSSPQPSNTVSIATAPTQTATTQNQLYAGGAGYTGNSIVDFLNAAKQPSDFGSRAKLAAQYGISNYTGTASQNTQLLNILKGYATGNVSQTGVPNTMSAPGTVPTPSSTINASNLTTGGTTDLSKILGANIPSGTISSDIAGLLSLYGATTDQQKQYDQTVNQLLTAMQSLGSEGADLEKAMRDQGVYANYEQVKQLNLRAAQLQGEIQTFDAETQKISGDIQNQAIPTGLLVGQQAALQRQRDITRLSKAAELSATLALSQAYQGNAEIGMQLAQKSVDLKYQPVLNQIEVLKAQLGYAADKLNREDTARSKIISALLDIKVNEINDQKAQQNKIQTMAIEAAYNGAPLSVVNQMKAATDPVEAARIGAAYIKGSLEKVGSTSGGGTSSSSSGAGGTYHFTSTQLNKGASTAKMTIDQFKGLPGDDQNFWINSYNTWVKELDQIASEQDVTDAINEVQNSFLSDTTKQVLINKIKSEFSVAGTGTNNNQGLTYIQQQQQNPPKNILQVLGDTWTGIKSWLGF